MPLNKAQKEAVEYTKEPLLIVAGAGTGKTTVIAEKIAHLLNHGLAKPEEILAVTFTEKAATEMDSRVDQKMNVGYLDLQISTFHAFCQKILERHAIDIGLSNSFRLLTDSESWMMLRKRLYDMPLTYYRPLGNPSRHIHELLKHFAKCKDELVGPEEYLEYVEELQLDSDQEKKVSNFEFRISNFETISNDKNSNNQTTEIVRLLEVADAYHFYQQLLRDTACFDFADLLFYTVKLFRERPNILAAYQKKFRYILVDEFQDVNWAQYQLVRLLAGEHNQLTVVGDDDQSIYAFRGASVSNILRFKEDFPKAKEIVLTENYRSSQEILDCAYRLIQHNNPDRLEVKLKIDKRLTSGSGARSQEPGEIQHIHCTNGDEEVDTVIDEIMRLKNTNSDITWDDFAILVRANSHAEPFLAGLERAGIPYEFLAAGGLYRQPIVLDCINFFKSIDNYHESSAIYRLLSLPCFALSEIDLSKIVHAARKKSMSYYEAITRAAEFQLSKEGAEICVSLLSLIGEGSRQRKKEKPSTILYHFLEGSGYLQYLASGESSGERNILRQIHYLDQFFKSIKRYEETIPGATIEGLLEQYRESVASGDSGQMIQMDETPDSVNVMTVHGAKGLEFCFVFVVNMVEERFPTRSRGEAIEMPIALVKEQLPEGDGHIEEERRLLYVAITRAKERLYLTSADSYGGVRKKKPSRFLGELGYEPRARSQEPGVKKILSTPPGIERSNQSNQPVLYELPSAFSFSQIRSYETCPYQYKLAHILKIPMKGSASFSFGSTMHNTLHAFYAKMQELNRATQTSLFSAPAPRGPEGSVQVPTLDELLALYKNKWIPDWYESKFQRETYYEKGKDILKIFYASHEGHWRIPASLEGWFKIKVGDVTMHGRIDRVDQVDDGTLEVIDYKTGASKEKLEGDEKDQLLLYQIAVQTLSEYRHLGPVGKLTFYYLNDNIQTSFLGTTEELEKLKGKLSATVQKIREGDFSATPSVHICGRCDFKDICEYRAV